MNTHRIVNIQVGTSSERIVISVAIPQRTVGESAGWVNTELAVNVGVWSARYAAQFHAAGFSSFATELRTLSSALDGVAELSSLDAILTSHSRAMD
jgi:hypothetical protein